MFLVICPRWLLVESSLHFPFPYQFCCPSMTEMVVLLLLLLLLLLFVPCDQLASNQHSQTSLRRTWEFHFNGHNLHTNTHIQIVRPVLTIFSVVLSSTVSVRTLVSLFICFRLIDFYFLLYLLDSNRSNQIHQSSWLNLCLCVWSWIHQDGCHSKQQKFDHFVAGLGLRFHFFNQCHHHPRCCCCCLFFEWPLQCLSQYKLDVWQYWTKFDWRSTEKNFCRLLYSRLQWSQSICGKRMQCI